MSGFMKNVITVEEMILESLKEMVELPYIGSIGLNTNQSKFVFPAMNGNGLPRRRVSEQEARILFIKQFEKYGDGFYSIEAPTFAKYTFSAQAKGARSGNVDVCVYGTDSKRKHLIEFKALNPGQQCFNKDFDKLVNDAEGFTNYFVHVIINSNKRTLPSIKKKYDNAYKYAIQKKYDSHSHLIIFLCDMGKRMIKKYDLNVNSTTDIIVPYSSSHGPV